MPGPQPRSDALWGRVRRWASKRAPQRDAIRLRGEPTTPCHSLVTPGAQDALLRVQVQGTPSPKALVSLSSIPRCPRAWHCGGATPVAPSACQHLRGASLLQLGPPGWTQSPPTAEAQETWTQGPAPGTPRLDIQSSWTDNGSSHHRRGGRHGGVDNGPVFLSYAFLQPLSAQALRGRLNHQKHSGAPDGSPVPLPSAQAEVGGPPYHTLPPSLPGAEQCSFS